MNEHEQQPTPEDTETGEAEADVETEADIERQNIRKEMVSIEIDVAVEGNPLTPELMGYYQELGNKLINLEDGDLEVAANREDSQKARFLLDYNCTALKFKAGFIEAAIEDLQMLGDTAYQAGEQYAHIVEMADGRRTEYEAALAQQQKS